MKESKTTAVPLGRHHIIKRPRLTRLLDETTARVIMLVAPAGYGKTTLARQWLADGDRRYLWCRASAASADVAALAGQLSRILSAIAPDVGFRVTEHLRAVEKAGLDERALTELLVTSVGRWPDDVWLAIDDYHHLLGSNAPETLIRELADQSQARLLLITRGRPTWASARRLLYGEIVEIATDALALRREEALEVLVDRDPAEVDALTSAASGWPAVIGLASLKLGPLWLDHDVPGELYEFFADEVYRALPRQLQRGLCCLAPATLIDSALANELFGAEATTFVEAAEAAGFLTYFERAFELHPLLRRFLLQRSREEGDPRVFEDWRRVIDYLMRSKRWDEAFTAIDTLDELDLIPRLVDEALDGLLADGRINTLVEWLRRAPTAESPVVDFALSEVALRRGDFEGTERLALKAATADGLPPHRTSRAWFRAGQAAHLGDQAERAFTHFHRARDSAKGEADLLEALWGLFLTSLDREDPRTLTYLGEYRRSGPLGEQTELRVANGLLMHANRFGGVLGVLDRIQSVTPLVSRVGDPLIRSAFLDGCAHVNVLAGRYEDALLAVDAELDEVMRFGLAFVAPHAYAAKAGACIGLRRLADAATAIREAEAALTLSGNPHNEMYLAVVKSRYHIAQGDLQRARQPLERDWERLPCGCLYGHYLAMRALVLASLGSFDEATQLVAQAKQTTRTIEASVVGRLVSAIIGFRREDPQASRVLLNVFQDVTYHRIVDPFVTAYRAHPDLTVSLRDLLDDESTLSEIVANSRDTGLADDAAARRSGDGTGVPLSPRELEVYDLLAIGASNRAIAQRLFISEATVKVHVRHIFEKLGVRTRTEAASRRREVDLVRQRARKRT